VDECQPLVDGGAALADVRPRVEFGEFRPGGAEGDDVGVVGVSVTNVPYMVRHRSVAKRWQGYFLCTKDGFKVRRCRFTVSEPVLKAPTSMVSALKSHIS
jgi:hypothetical protein